MTILQFILYVLIAFIAHELGHLFYAAVCCVPVRKIGLSWRGVYIQRARTVGMPEVIICLGGPLVNLLLAVMFFNAFHWFGICNLIFAVVNLIPLGSSDGAHALDELRGMLWRRRVERVRRNMA